MVSPIDEIRRFKPDGAEYWSARELMEWLGHKRWQSFGGKQKGRKSTIDISIESIHMGGDDPNNHFRRVCKLGHKPNAANHVGLQDWELTRYAVTIVTMNADPRLPTVKMARRYFIRQTIVAEQMLSMTQIERLQMALARAQAEELAAERANALFPCSY